MCFRVLFSDPNHLPAEEQNSHHLKQNYIFKNLILKGPKFLSKLWTGVKILHGHLHFLILNGIFVDFSVLFVYKPLDKH